VTVVVAFEPLKYVIVPEVGQFMSIYPLALNSAFSTGIAITLADHKIFPLEL
jgi:hypothetical protein